MSLIPSIVSSGSSQDPNNKGWFTTPAALSAAYPTGENGWFAIVGSTDTVWVWDTGTGDWVDSGASGTGDVTGPASSVDSNVALFDGTTGKVIKDGGALGALASRNTVASADIDSGAVDTIQLASDAVTTPKIADGNVSDAKLGTGINANKISSGTVSNTEFDYLNGTTSNIQTQIDAKLAEANSIFMPDYTKYCVDNRDDLATIISSITNESTVVNISQGSFGGTTPLVIDKDNIALIAPPATPAIVEFAYEISTATTADRIRMRYMQFDNDFNAGSRRSTYNHCTFNQDLNIQTSATAGYMTFFNCEFAADTTISVQNTFASAVYFINCNFAGCSFSLNQASNLQVIFSNCSNFISFPTNATYTHTNILTNGFSQNSVTKTLLATGSGTAGQVIASGGAGLPDTWVTPVSSTTDLSDVSTTLPVGGQVLEYSAATSRYEPANLSTSSLTDVSITAALDGQVLQYNSTSSEYEPTTLGGGSGTVTSVDTGNGLTGGPITTTGTIDLDFTESYTTSGTGSTTAPAGATFVKIVAGGAGGGGGGSGFSQADFISGYQGAGGGGGGAGNIETYDLVIKGGSTVLYYSIGAGGTGGTGQQAGPSSTPGNSGGETKVSSDSSHSLPFVTASGGSGGSNSSVGSSGGVEENGGDGGSGLYGGGGGGRGYYNGAAAIYGSNGSGGIGNPLVGDSATNTKSGDGAFNPGSGVSSVDGPGGGGGGPDGGSGGNAANGSSGSRGSGGGGAGGASSAGTFVPGHSGGDGGDGFVTFIWYFG